MDIAELILLLITGITLFACLYVPYKLFKTLKSKDQAERKWLKGALTIISLCLIISLANATSGEIYASLNAALWLIIIGPVMLIYFLLYHVWKLTKKKKNAGSSKYYIGAFIALCTGATIFYVADHYRDERNLKNYQNDLKILKCEIINESNQTRCTTPPGENTNPTRTLYERERQEAREEGGL